MTSRTRIGIWGVFGRGNFGNEATLEAVLDLLDPDRFEPVLLCTDPDAASALHGIPALALGTPVTGGRASRLTRIWSTFANRLRTLQISARAARAVDAVVVAGTGGLERYGSGAFGTPYELWALGLVCRSARRPFVLLDIGVEVLPRRLARYFARGTGRAASYRSYRDATSRSAMVANGLSGAASDAVVTDLAFALRPPRTTLSRQRTAVVAVMDYWGRESSHETGARAHLRYATEVEALVRDLLGRGWRVRLIGGDDGDVVFARELAERLAAGVPVVEARTPAELVEELSGAHVAIASRYHSVIMSLLAGTPVVPLGYAEKHREVLTQLDLPDLHVDIEEFVASEIAATAGELAEHRLEVSSQIDGAVDTARSRLEAQAHGLDAVLTGGRRR